MSHQMLDNPNLMVVLCMSALQGREQGVVKWVSNYGTRLRGIPFHSNENKSKKKRALDAACSDSHGLLAW